MEKVGSALLQDSPRVGEDSEWACLQDRMVGNGAGGTSDQSAYCQEAVLSS